MNYKLPSIIFLSFLLTACAFDKLNESLPYLKGQSIDTAMTYLGIPDQKMDLDKSKVYIWNHRDAGSYTVPVTSTTNYSGYGAYGSTGGTATTTSYTTQNYDNNCVIKLLTNKKGIIKSTDWKGDFEGCMAFIGAMDNIRRDFAPAPETTSK